MKRYCIAPSPTCACISLSFCEKYHSSRACCGGEEIAASDSAIRQTARARARQNFLRLGYADAVLYENILRVVYTFPSPYTYLYGLYTSYIHTLSSRIIYMPKMFYSVAGESSLRPAGPFHHPCVIVLFLSAVVLYSVLYASSLFLTFLSYGFFPSWVVFYFVLQTRALCILFIVCWNLCSSLPPSLSSLYKNAALNILRIVVFDGE